MLLNELRDYIGSLLEVSRFRDYSPNGVQVEGKAEVFRIATGVTASQRLLDAALAWGADAILVHHGYFWRGEDATLTGIKKQRIAKLLQADVSLLAYHLPLDAHPVLGNNAQLAQRLGFVEHARFGEQELACSGELVQVQSLDALAQQVADTLQRVPLVIGDGSRSIRRIAWCSGGAQDYFEQAAALGADAYLTGEISERHAHLAEELGVAFIAAGHHATERYGVQALGVHLAERFGLEHHFFDMDVPV
ncbi:GTP cyclohydrolase 1 type 2 [Ferriphaselus amnicola]|uniref:GTP cyclohydrolase 1 type 2 homolog n=1 Tax=Ferriphaselus amnicola TaxID=1188319 RepID=A0A2Z6GA54_9PROT|nr:Nif3-like dinuclear metal center hexameric protein [Ferriphaselus amnicola]BBE50229.1 GTP cyclohydrolase 1 type 2 [Ferriphaselus amnicola]